jgi:hypothetical protein
MEKCDNQGGIWYHPNQIKNAVSIFTFTPGLSVTRL